MAEVAPDPLNVKRAPVVDVVPSSIFSFSRIVIGVVDDPRWKLKFPVDPSAAPLALTVHLLFGYPVFIKLISPNEFAAEVIPT